MIFTVAYSPPHYEFSSISISKLLSVQWFCDIDEVQKQMTTRMQVATTTNGRKGKNVSHQWESYAGNPGGDVVALFYFAPSVEKKQC